MFSLADSLIWTADCSSSFQPTGKNFINFIISSIHHSYFLSFGPSLKSILCAQPMLSASSSNNMKVRLSYKLFSKKPLKNIQKIDLKGNNSKHWTNTGSVEAAHMAGHRPNKNP